MERSSAMVDWSRTADPEAQLAETHSHITAHTFHLYAEAVESTQESHRFFFHLLFNHAEIFSTL